MEKEIPTSKIPKPEKEVKGFEALANWEKEITTRQIGPKEKGTGWARVPKKFWIGMLAGSTPAERVMAIELKVYANKQGECWPSVSLMVKDTQLNKNTIIRSLKALEKKELIKIFRTKGKHNFYKFNHLSC